MSATVSPFLRNVTNAMTEGPSAPPKRSLFKKPNWAAKSTSIAKAETEFFDHRDSTYSGILAEKEKKRQKNRAKAATQAGDGHGHEPKRRRLSEDEESDLSTESSDDEEKTRSWDIPREGPVTRSTPTRKGRNQSPRLDRSVKTLSPVSPPKASNKRIIDLAEEDGEVHPTTDSLPEPKIASPIKPRPEPMLSDPESEDEDEYTLELKRKAREKARQRKLGLNSSKSMIPEPQIMNSQSPQLKAPSQSSSADLPEASLHESPPQISTLKREGDMKVMILIRTAIPNTNQLIVNRWASQNLQQVKEAWCKRQGFDAAMARNVFLTWRGKKLFNTTTLTHILRTLKAERKKFGAETLDSDDEDSDPSQGKIEVEAT